MPVIAVLNQKGGAGKTTLSTHIARELQRRGRTVLLVDSDPQGSARDWAAASDSQPVPVVGIDRPTLERDLKSLAPVDYVVIDGAPQVSALAVSAIKVADIILIPVQPSPYDLWAAADLVDLVKQRIDLTDGKLRAAFVVSRQIIGTGLSSEIPEILGGYGLPVFESKISQRVEYPRSAVTGSTAMDAAPSSAAAQEIQALVNELQAFEAAPVAALVKEEAN